MSICCRVIDQLVCYFFGGERKSFFFSLFENESTTVIYVLCYVRARARSRGMLCVC
jgi:hypothetical protein